MQLFAAMQGVGAAPVQVVVSAPLSATPPERHLAGSPSHASTVPLDVSPGRCWRLVAAGAARRRLPPRSDPTSAIAAAALASYRAEWRAFEQALADANPEDPELAATTVPSDPDISSALVSGFCKTRKVLL